MMNLSLNSFIPYWTDGKGVFNSIASPGTWATGIDLAELDFELFSNYGWRTASPLIMAAAGFPNMLDVMTVENHELTEAQINKIAAIIEDRFQENWNRYYGIQHSEYNPLENYNGKETEKTDYSDTLTLNTNDERKNTGTQTDTSTPGVSETVTTTNGTTTTSQTSAFNSTEWQDSEKTTNGGSDTSTSTKTGTDTNQRTDNLTETYKRGGTETHTTETEITRERAGNLGVTTSQQMAEAEIKLWGDFNYIRKLIEDAANVLTLPIF